MIRHVIVKKNGATKAEDLHHIGPRMELFEEEDIAQHMLEMYIIPDRRHLYTVRKLKLEIIEA